MTSNYQYPQIPSLLEIPPNLIERIATKFDWKSYFRLQQTCHDMADFFRTSRNVRVCLPDSFSLYIGTNLQGFPQYYLATNNVDNVFTSKTDKGRADLKSLYGARLGFIQFRGGLVRITTERNYIMDLCKTLKKYRITTRDVDAYWLQEPTSQYENGEYEELLKILKPVKVHLDSEGSNRWEVLLKAKQLKEISISTLVEDHLDLVMIKSLLKKCPKLEINAYSKSIEDFYRLADQILEHVRSEPLPNLRSFMIRGISNYVIFMCTAKLNELFPKYKFTYQQAYRRSNGRVYNVYNCQMGLHDDRVCELSVGKNFEIHFRNADFYRHD